MIRIRQRLQAGFTLVELMIVVAIIGILAAVAIPQFMKYIKKSKTAEATKSIQALFDSAQSYYEDEHMSKSGVNVLPLPRQFPTSVATTPASGTCCTDGGKCTPNDAYWTDPTWVALKFSHTKPHYYWYTFQSAGTVQTSVFTATANGDLDCDATLSTFEALGAINAEGEVTGGGGSNKIQELE